MRFRVPRAAETGAVSVLMRGPSVCGLEEGGQLLPASDVSLVK